MKEHKSVLIQPLSSDSRLNLDSNIDQIRVVQVKHMLDPWNASPCHTFTVNLCQDQN